MSRLFRARLALLFITAATVSSCGGKPSPRVDVQTGIVPPANEAVRVGTIPATPPPPISGESAIVVDVGSGRVLYAKNADQPRAVASTQKIITALCILDAGNIDKQVVIEPIY